MFKLGMALQADKLKQEPIVQYNGKFRKCCCCERNTLPLLKEVK